MFYEVMDQFQDFMESGGQVLWLIFAVTFALWVLILEKVMYLRKDFPKQATEIKSMWKKRPEHSSWNSLRIREWLLSDAQMNLRSNVPLIKTLVALCPLLGLLGTVTGMIAVFDVMAITGTGNARSMASGISMATIPTMAGMVAALSGIYLSSFLESKTKAALDKLTDQLLTH